MKNISKLRQNYLNSLKTYKFVCKRCGKEYELTLSETKYKNHTYSDYCSRSCSNTRVRDEKTKQK